MRSILTIFVCLCFIQAKAQVNAGFQSLTKEHMVEDFKFLCDKLQKVNTRFEVVKKVTGTDILKDISQLQQNLDTITSEAGFYDILYRAMMLCKDQHISFSSEYPYSDRDTTFMNDAKRNTQKLAGVFNKYDPNINPFQVYYVEGEYFVPDIFDRDGRLQIPAKSRLLKINGLPVDEFVEKWVIPVCSKVKWDHKNRKFYVQSFISPQRLGQSDKFVVTYSYLEEVKEIELVSHGIIFPTSRGMQDPAVHYFDEDKILYIRVPSMNQGLIEDYKKEIAGFLGKDIAKVVIDIRRNRGGSDGVWMNIVSAIINEPVSFQQRLAFKDNPLVKEYLKKNQVIYTEEEVERKPLYIGQDTFFCLREQRELKPLENSLKYEGKIYVLVDDKCFSSALAFSSYCQGVDQLVTVGTSSGYFGGQGVTPFYFILPNSKLICRIECSLDASGVNEKNVEEYYHDQVEIPITISLDDIFRERHYKGVFFSMDYLYGIDPVFKGILK